MSDHNQPEPSMEEILASIRRIISEEGSDKAGQAAAAPAPKPQRQPIAAPEPDTGGDVLVLTEMVAEDGSVVRLDEAADLESERARRRSVTPLRPDPVEATESIGSAVEEAPAPAKAQGYGEARANVPPLDTPGVAVEEPRAAPRPAPRDNGLLSKKAAEATAAAFAQLSSGLVREPASAAGGGVTLEAFVRQSLEPMLQAWLDANLPGIIERLMKEEMERIARASRGQQ